MSVRLVLASTSRYRRELLERLRLPFDVARPEVDETPQPHEAPAALARRLAAAKAAAVAGGIDAWVIGSDQVASLDGRPVGKPGSVADAHGQLRRMSGQAIEFLTAVCVAHRSGHTYQALDTTVVRFRELDDAAIVRYIETERPLDCAGSFKSEGLGIALFDAIETVDPTALVGLPLIATARLLRQAGFAVP
jgi:septum formation protein